MTQQTFFLVWNQSLFKEGIRRITLSLFDKDKLKKYQKEEEYNNHTILVVDDEEANLRSLKRILEKDYEVLTANNGEEALNLVKTDRNPERFHLILSDQRMPKMTGVELFKHLIEIIPKAIRIIVTGYTDLDAIIGFINDGHIYQFISKPIELQDLQVTIRRALDSYNLNAKNENLLEELKILNKDLEKKVELRTRDLSQSLDELQKINAVKDKLFSIIAHDLRSPYSLLVSTTELLMYEFDELNKEEVLELILELHSSSKRGLFLLENLLEWARIQTGRIDIKFLKFNVFEIISEIIELKSKELESKKINLKIEIPNDLEIITDINIFQTVIRNFLSNAIKFSKINGDIDINITKVPNNWRLYVKDFGIGISQDDIKKIQQENIYHTTYGTKKEKGSGLGLKLCKELIEMLGGKLVIESEPGKGSTFIYEIPSSS